jgi:hypothetical protein
MNQLNLNRSNVTLACDWCLKDLKCDDFENKLSITQSWVFGFWVVRGKFFGENLTVGNDGGFLYKRCF